MPDPTLTPDPEQFKAANLFEAWDNLKEDNQRIESEEMEWYLEELHNQSLYNRRMKDNMKLMIEGMIDSGYKNILLNQLNQIKL